MHRRILRHLPGLLAALVLLQGALPRAGGAAGASVPRYEIDASISPADAVVEGWVHVALTNASGGVLRDAVFFLFPNRFSQPEESENDFNRPFLYFREEFQAGGMEILEARDGERTAEVEPLSRPHLPDGTLARLWIDPLAPGETRILSVRFRTRVPQRYGTFGAVDHELTLLGGWFPYLAALGDDGTWRVDLPPQRADFDLRLSKPDNVDVVVNGRRLPRGDTRARVQLRGVHYVSLLSSPHFEATEARAGETRLVLLRSPRRFVSRLAFGPSTEEMLLQTASEILEKRPEMLPPPPAELVLVEAPLRLELTASAEGAVVLSDRAFKVHRLIRPFHELQLAQAIYTEILDGAARREPEDYPWVREGLGRVLARQWLDSRHPDTRTVYDWIELFNIFAIVDRFESAPKIPFVESFFERARTADPLHAGITTFNRDLPPGRVILGKLKNLLGESLFDRVVARCAASDTPFRACAADIAGRDLESFFEQWLQPYPELNYHFDEVDLNQPENGGFRHRLRVRRDSSRRIQEPVPIRLRSLGGREVDVSWNGAGATGNVEVDTPGRFCQAVIDPDRTLIEDRRDDNASPPWPQVVLDTANVEVTSTEFGFAALVVGRKRYDYRKDLALAGVYTNRGIGFTAGARYHWGTPIDPTLYRHNLYLFYGFQALDGGFVDKRKPSVRTDGQLASLGVRYDYTNVFAYDNPTDARNLRLYADWYDGAFGSDFEYVDWGIDASATHPLWTHRTIGALEILNGFSEAIDGDTVPNQGLYSLGGSRSIRGIGAEEELGRNIFLVRAEVRQSLYPEVDFNLLDLLVLRRAQISFFVDSGRVDNSAGRVYDVGGFAAGAGIGLGAVYEFMGFFPSVAYIELATRIDQASKLDDVQFLFGTRQPF